jgi:excisionase family DNA binding protein
MSKKYLTSGEAAKVLGISRIAVFKRIVSGKLKAKKIGGRYLIEEGHLGLARRELTAKDKERIQRTVQQVLKEYGSVIRKLGNE